MTVSLQFQVVPLDTCHFVYVFPRSWEKTILATYLIYYWVLDPISNSFFIL